MPKLVILKNILSKKTIKMSNCIFCDIIQKKLPAKIRLENDDVMVFEDIKPAATHHYLAVPKVHMENVNSLNDSEHKTLLENLISAGRKAVEEQGGDVNDLRLGFHLPPFNSVRHLHLHVISPASSMSFWHRLIFKPDTWWFVSAEQIQQKLAALEDPKNFANKL